jgi:hypothetical protein
MLTYFEGIHFVIFDTQYKVRKAEKARILCSLMIFGSQSHRKIHDSLNVFKEGQNHRTLKR